MSPFNKQLKLETGVLLLAEPFMPDPQFRRSVLLLCDHHEEGSFGFILNKPISMTISSVVANFPNFNSPVYYGGPVQTDTVHYLHTKGDLLQGSVEIIRGLFWGGDFEQLKFCIENELMSPSEVRFFIGYSGWEPGQLEEELKEPSWLMAQGDANYVFGSNPPEDLWKFVLENEGDRFGVIAQMGLPNWN